MMYPNIYVPLSRDEREFLNKLAGLEFRSPKEQARKLLVEALQSLAKRPLDDGKGNIGSTEGSGKD